MIVQHRIRQPTSDCLLLKLLAECSPLPVREVEDKDPIQPGCVYLAPADYHLLVERGHFALSIDVAVCHARPSIDVLFESAALAYGARVIGVVLTGSNDDGAQGASEIARRGGRVLVEDPATSEAPEMPAAAIALTPRLTVLPLSEIAAFLTGLGLVPPRG